jgi:hypothetical protein
MSSAVAVIIGARRCRQCSTRATSRRHAGRPATPGNPARIVLHPPGDPLRRRSARWNKGTGRDWWKIDHQAILRGGYMPPREATTTAAMHGALEPGARPVARREQQQQPQTDANPRKRVHVSDSPLPRCWRGIHRVRLWQVQRIAATGAMPALSCHVAAFRAGRSELRRLRIVIAAAADRATVAPAVGAPAAAHRCFSGSGSGT